MHNKRQILKQKEMDVASYTEEFQKLFLRSKVQEEEIIRVARYLGGLIWIIQEEINLWTPTTMHKCFQLALKVKEKNKKKQDSNPRGRGRGRDSTRHRGGYGGRSSEPRSQGDYNMVEKSNEPSGRGIYGRGRGFQGGGRGRSSSFSRGSHFVNMKCYNCGQLGHLAYRCLDKASSSQGEKKIAYAQE